MTPDQLTEDQKKMIRGVNAEQIVHTGRGGTMALPGNIGALHFDGKALADMIDVFVRLNPR